MSGWPVLCQELNPGCQTASRCVNHYTIVHLNKLNYSLHNERDNQHTESKPSANASCIASETPVDTLTNLIIVQSESSLKKKTVEQIPYQTVT